MSSLVDRLRESMVMNHERWHDGTGYDLSFVAEATPEEFRQIEDLLLAGGVRDWRDVEALAALDTPRARERLREALIAGDEDLRLALATHAAHLFSEDELCGILLPILREKGIHDGLVGALLVVEEFHPAPVMRALLEGARDREGPVAAEFATMLLYLNGKIASLYDFSERPFLLRFHDEDRTEVFRELCERIGTES
jgi:hypothetical protein